MDILYDKLIPDSNKAVILGKEWFLDRPGEVGWPRHEKRPRLVFDSSTEARKAAEWINDNLVGKPLEHNLGTDYVLTIQTVDVDEAGQDCAFSIYSELNSSTAQPVLEDPNVEKARRKIGDIDSHGAIFVYKCDGTEDAAWRDIESINRAQVIRGELHREKSIFLSSLKHWNETLRNPAAAMLCIYAHAGPLGMNCKRGDANRRVTWAELAAALPKGVGLLWLLGCKTECAIDNWGTLATPVKDVLLVTAESKYWLPFLRLFRKEMDLNWITPYDEMPALLRAEQPGLAGYTRYFRVIAGRFEEYDLNASTS